MDSSADPVDAAMSTAAGSYALPTGPASDPVDDAMTAAAGEHAATAPISHELTFGNTLKGEAELAATGVANIPYAAAHSAVDLWRRWTGGDTNAPDSKLVGALKIPTGEAAKNLIGGIAELPATQAVVAGAKSADKVLGDFSPTLQDVAHQTLDVAGDVGNLTAGGEAPGTAIRAVKDTVGALRTGASAVSSGAKAAGSAIDSALGRAPPPTAQDVLTNLAQNSKQSMGAAAAAPSMGAVSPELKQAIVTAAQKNGGAVPPDVLARHVEADTLPVPVQLTEGQATQDPVTLSNEFNARLKNPDIAQRLSLQNTQLVQNLQAMRDKIGPYVFSTNPVEHGDTLIQAYQDKGAAADADISSKYQALRDANGGQFPVDAPTLLKNATNDLHQQLLFDHAPSAVMRTLGRLADNDNMTFENFESLRTNLARVQRTSQDGNEVAAAGVIRNAMEQLPLKPEAAALKPLADDARSAAKAQFDLTTNKDSDTYDPAYAAAVHGTVPPDKFVQKFIVGAPRDDVETMRQNLAGNDTATQTMGVAALDHLSRQTLGKELPNALDVDSNGNAKATANFSQANYGKNVETMAPKFGSLFEPDTAETLSKIGNVARNTQFQGRGSAFNNSGTFVAQAGEHAANLAEAAGNATLMAHGVPIPGVSILRKVAQNRSAAKTAQKSLAPGAGLDRLSPTSP